MKKFIAGFLTCALLMSGTFVYAETNQNINVWFGRVKLLVNGKSLNQETLLYNGTTYVPLRAAGEIFGQQIGFDSNTKTAYVGNVPPQFLDSSSAANKPIVVTGAADIIIVSPLSADIGSNGSVTVTVTGNQFCEQAVIKNSSGTTLATEKAYKTTSSGNRDFSVKFTPPAAGTFRAYVVDANGTTASRSLQFEVNQSSTADIKSISPSSTTSAFGETVEFIVTANSDTAKVRLVSDDESKDTVDSSKNYEGSSSSREFALNWNLKESYYKGMSTVSARIYAIDSDGVQGGYKTVTVKIDAEGGGLISSATANKTSVNVDDEVTLTVKTATNVQTVSFDITSGDGELEYDELDDYDSKSSGSLTWKNKFTATESGTVKIKVTAEPKSGSSKTATISITVKGESSGSVTYEQYPAKNAKTSGYVDLTVFTGKNVGEIEWVVKSSVDGTVDSGSVSSYSGTNTKREWVIGNVSPLYSSGGNYTLTVTLYNNELKKTGTNSYAIK